MAEECENKNALFLFLYYLTNVTLEIILPKIVVSLQF